MLAIRPPEYWPRLEFMALVAAVDRMVIADTFQYSRQSYQNRTRVRTPGGWCWMTVPLLGGQHGRPVLETRIEQREPWLRKHWRTLEYNYRSTPYFELYEPRLAPLFEHNWKYLGDLTSETVRVTCRLFNLPTRLERASELPGMPATAEAVWEAAGAGAVMVPADSIDRDRSVFADVRKLSFEEPVYRQCFDGFEGGVTALDLLFNHGPDARRLLFHAGGLN